MARHTTSKSERQVFTISRELEYFTTDELEKQTGYSRNRWWPEVILKETVDNALDAAETAGVPPEIAICWNGSKLEVRDNGGGIPAETVRRLADYSTCTSDKLAYVSPTRGAQGNAWKTILAIPCVLDGEAGHSVVIEAQGARQIQASFLASQKDRGAARLLHLLGFSLGAGGRVLMGAPAEA